MKVLLFALLVGMAVACEDPGDRYVKRFEMVEISKTLIPDTTIQLDYMQIRAKAQAENGCWGHLYFEMKKIKEFEYTLKAYGTFESFGICDDNVVTKDSIFNFQPIEKGTYLFHISRKATEVDIDTMIVE